MAAVWREQPAAEQGVAYLLFGIGPITFAVEAKNVGEIVAFGQISRAPSLPRCILGLMNLRGTVLPVIDLAVKFGGERTTVDKRSCIVVVEAQHEGTVMLLGLVTGAVQDVVTVLPSQIEPPPAFGALVDVAYLSGMARYGDGFALIMNTDRLLSVEELLRAENELLAVEPTRVR